MRKHPHVELQDGAEKHDYEAREPSGDERAAWWERAPSRPGPTTADYQEQTDRQIPLFALTRIVT